MTIFARQKGHHKKIMTSTIALIHNMVQSKEASDDVSLILHYVDENILVRSDTIIGYWLLLWSGILQVSMQL
jgi:hypothetical protein